jgi:holo-[acyl-carrier protein] synthase
VFRAISQRIVGVGLDIVDLARLARALDRHGERFVRRFCRHEELLPRAGRARLEHLGGLFAAKEAAMKALGTGWGDGVSFLQVEVRRGVPGSPPVIQLHDRARQLAADLGVDRVHLSISHDGPVAAAVVVLEGSGP